MTRLGASRLWIAVPVSSHDGVQPARLVAPVNGAVLLADDARRGVALRWTPLIPRPRDDGAAYRVRVWQLMQGDDAMKAKARTPILEKKGITEAQLIVPLPLGGSCTVQSPCHFVWNVQALNRVGTPTPGVDGSDNTFRFAVGGPAK